MARHEALLSKEWNADIAYNRICQILLSAENYLHDMCNIFSSDDQVTAKNANNSCLYDGLAGVLWGLNHLSHKYEVACRFDSKELVSFIHKQYLQKPEYGAYSRGYLVGEGGILFLSYLLGNVDQIESNLYECIEGNACNPTWDLFSGSPGTMLIALMLFDKTAETKWLDLYRLSAEILIDEIKFSDAQGVYYWQHSFSGKVHNYIGAAHGFFGAVFPLIKGREHLSELQNDFILKVAKNNFEKLAILRGDLAFWPVALQGGNFELIQWCHGAPGVIQCMECLPRDDADMEVLLIKAGNAIWGSGPLTKGISLCHGTDGNGMALLQLYQRTNNEAWLDKARRFAMHLTNRNSNKFTLWTGDMGLACFLDACIGVKSYFPGLHLF